MKIQPIHHIPMKPEYRSPYSAGFAVEDARIVLLAGCCTIPIYHKHPHDPHEEAQWPAGDIREQKERTFEQIQKIHDHVGGDFYTVLQVTRYPNKIKDHNVLTKTTA